MHEFLLSADFMVPDPDGFAALLVKRLGVLTRDDYRQAFPTHGYIAHFLRTHKSLAVAPTRLEPQHHIDVPKAVDPIFADYLDSIDEFQGRHRPIKTHSLVIACSDIEGLLEKLHRRKLPFRVAPIDERMPWERVWVGTTPERPRYTPVVDGGLCLEWIPVGPLRMPPATFTTPPPEPLDPQPGEMVRVVSRSFLVRDLDDVLRHLSTNLDIEPDGPVELFEDEGFRRARFGFALAHAAKLDLIEPTRWNSETGKYLHTWGPGPYLARISVSGLEARAADLSERDTRFSRVPELPSVGGPALRVDPADLDGALIEFVEHSA